MTANPSPEIYRQLDRLHPALRPFPTKLYVEVTTRCNLNCFMCVKQAGGGICEGDLPPYLFSRLEPVLPHVETLILNGIGEPLLHPDLERFIRTAKHLMPKHGWVGFQTNGLLLTRLRAISLVEAGLDRICLSIDGASPETFRKVREGSDLPDIEHAFAALAAAKEQCGQPGVQVGIEYVVMRSNLAELPAALEWAARHGASFAIVTHALPYRQENAAEAAFDTCTADAKVLFESCRVEAERQGLDIYGYLDARWKYARTTEEQKLVNLVEEMKTEASRRDVFIDMKKLLRMNIEQAEEVARVMARAKAVAEQAGIDLRLPEIALSRERHCSFVEDGGAFVSWEGNVSPCYFLWHRYRCFASGWEQEVNPKVFGNLARETMEHIWNSREFRDFREQVIAYDYPTCASCSLAPCDYVQTDRFEQDCHIGDVPCGACLWCMGVFHCLQ